uniref:Putative secreted protein n=1 Tax=Ixodes ricinus TaxID=34613 RepID=A0A6B0UJH6_IXORI
MPCFEMHLSLLSALCMISFMSACVGTSSGFIWVSLSLGFTSKYSWNFVGDLLHISSKKLFINSSGSENVLIFLNTRSVIAFITANTSCPSLGFLNTFQASSIVLHKSWHR